MARFPLKWLFVGTAVVAALVAWLTSEERAIKRRLALIATALSEDSAACRLSRHTVIDADLFALRIDGDPSLNSIRQLVGSRVAVIWLNGHMTKEARSELERHFEKVAEQIVDGRTYEVYSKIFHWEYYFRSIP